MPWLMKAEPDSRIVKGKDVKFSVDDFEDLGVSPWDGVRNHEAKVIMRDKMKLGDKVLFYHSNCKIPGVFAIAEVAKEGYPDYTAWDQSHPYYDVKSDKDSPTWYMVDVKFIRRLAHPVTLAFVKSLVGLAKPPPDVDYIGVEGLKAIQSMALVNRGRLSVQPVGDDAFEAIVALGDKGGFEVDSKPSKTSKGNAANKRKAAEDGETETKVKVNKNNKRKAVKEKVEKEDSESLSPPPSKPVKSPSKRTTSIKPESTASQPVRRSTRNRK